MQHNTIQRVNSPGKQAGATLVGMAFVAAGCIFIAVIAMKMVPSYIEHLSIKKVLQAMGQESLDSMSRKEIMADFDKRRSVAYVDRVAGSDLIIEKNDLGKTVVSVQYQVTQPIVGNVSVLMDFEASVDAK